MPNIQLLYCSIAELLKRKKQSNNLTIKQFKLGFTFIELLVVISIIAILVTAIIATFSGAQAKARDARRREDLDALKKALELAKSDSAGTSWYAACNPAAVSCAPGVTTPLLSPSYIRAVPLDPTGIAYIYVPLPGPACTYTVATNSGTCNSFDLIACLENNNAPVGVDGVEAKPAAPLPGSGCPAAQTKIYRVSNS